MTLAHESAADLFGSLSSLVRASRAAAHRHTGELGATGTAAGLLKLLTHGDARPSDLAVALHVAPSVVSRAVVPLEEQGLVARTTDPCDARASLLTLTGDGRDRVAVMQEAYVELLTSMLTDWSDQEAEQAAGLLNRLCDAVVSIGTPELQHRLISDVITEPGSRPSPPIDPARTVERDRVAV